MTAETPRPRPVRRYLMRMIRRASLAFLATLTTLPAFGQGGPDTTFLNALRDRARAEERQAESLTKIERVERDRARDEDRARRNAARDSRSARRFDYR